MITIEDRIRRAIAETAEEITADHVPPLRLPLDRHRLPGPRTRILAAVAAAASVAAVAITAVVIARGQAPQPRTHTWTATAPPALARQLRRALRAWSDFPVSRSPRPLVVVGFDINDPASGFASGAAKDAYLQRAIDFPARLPSGPGRMSGYPLISAARAVTVFKSTAAKGPPVSARLTVASIRLGAGVFETDRGQRRLPAWLIAFRGVRDPAAVLAVAPASIFAAPRQYGRWPEVTTALISAHGRILELRFIGGPAGSGPCSVSYRGYLAVTPEAVSVVLSGHTFGGPGAVCAEPGYLRHVTIRLPVPLGGRVVVDAVSGLAVAVSRAASGG